MARYERTLNAKDVHLWVVERRGRMLWTREGTAGATGRIRTFEHESEAEAAAACAAMIEAKRAEGFVLADEASTVSSPFRSSAQLEHTRLRREAAKHAGAASDGITPADPSELLGELERTVQRPGATTREIVEALLAAAIRPCTWRLHRLAFAFAEEPTTLSFHLTFAKGKGSNVDDYDFDGALVRCSFGDGEDLEEDEDAEALAPDTEEDGFELDTSDGSRGAQPQTLVTRFRRAIQDEPAFQEHADQAPSRLRIVR